MDGMVCCAKVLLLASLVVVCDALTPRVGGMASSTLHRSSAACRMCANDPPPPSDNNLTMSLQAELQKRGLQTALDHLAEDGPSAFKDASKIIEYVMLTLQHQGTDGIEEAFRFTSRQPGQTSFVSGLPLSSRRVSWARSRFIGGYVSGKYLELDEWSEEVQANYSRLLNCATWRWAVVHPLSGEPLVREAERDFCREYSIMVDERPVAIQMHYDWGCWCYLIYKVIFLDEADPDMVELGDAASRDAEGYDGRSSRSRGGSL